MGLFDLDETLTQEPSEKYDKLLRKANLYLLREDFDKALEIYEGILKEDMECLEAYIGILRVHSKDYTVYEGEDIEKDIRVILKVFGDVDDEDFINYLSKRKKYLQKIEEHKEEIVKQETEIHQKELDTEANKKQEEALKKKQEEEILRQKQEEAARQEAEIHQKELEAEARRKAEEEAKARAAEEARRKAEEEAAKQKVIDKYGFYITESDTEIDTSIICQKDKNIKKMIVPSWVKSFKFSIYDSNIESIIFEDGCETINGPVSYNSLLKEVVLPNTLTILEGGLSHSQIKSIKIPSSLKTIGNNTFVGCKDLQKVELSPGLIHIGMGAFSLCSALQSVEIPEGVTSLGCCAFDHCSSLSSIKLPKSLREIQGIAFLNCKSLMDIRYAGTIEEWKSISIDQFNWSSCPASVIHCVDGDVAPYH